MLLAMLSAAAGQPFGGQPAPPAALLGFDEALQTLRRVCVEALASPDAFNAGASADAALFDKLGLRAMTRAEPARAAAE